MFIFFLLQLIWYFLKVYAGGAWYLLDQITHRRRKLHGIPLQTGKVVIVTGGAAGIGFHIAKGLVARNVHVFIGGKSVDNGKNAVTEIRKEFPNAKVDFIQVDLSSLKSTRNFADIFLARNLPLHILINNAGIMMVPYKRTCDGIESQMQVNYLSHFYLTQLLLDTLRRSGADNSHSRIVNVSSSMHYLATADANNISKRCDNWWEYSSHAAYCESKLAIVASTHLLARKLREEGAPVSVCALHPGVVNTNIYDSITLVMKLVLKSLGKFLYLTPEQGADTPLFAALSPEVEGQSGCYYDNAQKCRSSGVSYCEEFQKELWQNSVLAIEGITD